MSEVYQQRKQAIRLIRESFQAHAHPCIEVFPPSGLENGFVPVERSYVEFKGANAVIATDWHHIRLIAKVWFMTDAEVETMLNGCAQALGGEAINDEGAYLLGKAIELKPYASTIATIRMMYRRNAYLLENSALVSFLGHINSRLDLLGDLFKKYAGIIDPEGVHHIEEALHTADFTKVVEDKTIQQLTNQASEEIDRMMEALKNHHVVLPRQVDPSTMFWLIGSIKSEIASGRSLMRLVEDLSLISANE